MRIVENIEQCALALFSAYSKFNGGIVDDAKVMEKLTATPSKMTYADADLKYGKAVTSLASNPAVKFFAKYGINVADAAAEYSYTDSVLGDAIPKQVESLYHHHLAGGTRTYENWRANYAPIIARIRDNLLPTLAPEKRAYASNYFDNHIKGYSLYGSRKQVGFIGGLTRNLVKNFIDWNPSLIAFHGLEFMPKFFSYAVEHAGPVKGPLAAMEALAKTKWIGKEAALDKIGIYGTEAHGKGFFGYHRLVDISEIPIRTASYHLGEILGTGGTHAVEKIPFVYRFGYEPMAILGGNSFNELGLMRYVLASGKMYSGWATRAIKDPNAAMALATFSLFNAVQTGSKSVIPLPVQAALPQDFKDKCQEIDDTYKLNWVKQAFGTDLSEKAAPGAFPAIGVPYAMLTQQGNTVGRDFSKAAQAAYEGNATDATARIVKALFGIGQVGAFPGVNIGTKRVVDTAVKIIEGDVPADPESAAKEYLKASHIYNEPKE